MEPLLSVFSEVVRLEPSHQKLLMESVERKEHPGKTLLQGEDRVSDSIYFVEKGIARTFTLRMEET